MSLTDEWTPATLVADPMRFWRANRDANHRPVNSKYQIMGFISSGTYGRVYKAQAKDGTNGMYAIKKFKPDKDAGEGVYTGISQSAIREITLNRELLHENIVALREVIFEDKAIHMVFEYAEHDFLQLIHHYSSPTRGKMPTAVLKSLIFQLLNGVLYLHAQHVLHRDLKPANVLVDSSGCVKIGDLGLARVIREPLQTLWVGDKVVVTIWYRAPELLLGSRHYTRAIDMWAVACVMAELASLRPIFKGDEAKMDAKKGVVFQRDQMTKIFEVLGSINEQEWPGVREMPDYAHLREMRDFPSQLMKWCDRRMSSLQAYDIMHKMLLYDPNKRFTAQQALQHPWFHEEPLPAKNAFASIQSDQLPQPRRITHEDPPSALPSTVPGLPVAPNTVVGARAPGPTAHMPTLPQAHGYAAQQVFAALAAAGRGPPSGLIPGHGNVDAGYPMYPPPMAPGQAQAGSRKKPRMG